MFRRHGHRRTKASLALHIGAVCFIAIESVDGGPCFQ
jgi:hypothetical protein